MSVQCKVEMVYSNKMPYKNHDDFDLDINPYNGGEMVNLLNLLEQVDTDLKLMIKKLLRGIFLNNERCLSAGELSPEEIKRLYSLFCKKMKSKKFMTDFKGAIPEYERIYRRIEHLDIWYTEGGKRHFLTTNDLIPPIELADYLKRNVPYSVAQYGPKFLVSFLKLLIKHKVGLKMSVNYDG